MPIPWLIGAAVIAAGAAVVKAINDSDDETREEERRKEEHRAMRDAEREAERENERQRKAFKGSEQKRKEKDRLSNLKKRAEHELKIVISKYNIRGVDINELIKLSIKKNHKFVKF